MQTEVKCAHCSRRAEPGRSVCTQCRLRSAGRRELRSRIGDCTHCGRRSADCGYKSCAICRGYLKAKYLERRDRRRSMGLCLRCPNKSYGVLCDVCAKRAVIPRRLNYVPKYRRVDTAILSYLEKHGECESCAVMDHLDTLGLLAEAPPSIGERRFTSYRLYDLKKRDLVSRAGRLWRAERGD